MIGGVVYGIVLIKAQATKQKGIGMRLLLKAAFVMTAVAGSVFAEGRYDGVKMDKWNWVQLDTNDGRTRRCNKGYVLALEGCSFWSEKLDYGIGRYKVVILDVAQWLLMDTHSAREGRFKYCQIFYDEDAPKCSDWKN